MNTRPRIALAQIRYFDVSKSNNLEKILRYIRLAKKKDADIICFPESCLHKKGALGIDSEIIRQVAEECRNSSIWCIITDDIESKGKVHNTSILIDRKGRIKGKYRKIHLYGDETLAGRKSFVTKTDFGKIGIAICWDLAFPELFRKMKSQGAQIVFCPAQWWYDDGVHEEEHQKRETEILKSLVLARAYENVMFVALCNPIMDRKHLVPYSAIASPVRILKETRGKQGLIIQDLNLDEIKKLHEIYEN